jgi:outer membrane protein assembly factor BamD
VLKFCKMKKVLLVIVMMCSCLASPAYAFWMWTPETGKWENPKFAVKETPSEQLKYALTFYKVHKYKEATREFKKLIDHYPRAKEAPDAQFYIGLSLEEQDKFFDAYKAYQVVVEKYPFSERSAEIVKKQYKIGEKLLEGEKDKSDFMEALTGTNYNVIEVFRTVIKNAPYGPLAPQAQYKIGLYLLEKGLYQEARDEFEKVMNDYPESEWAKPAQYQSALADSKRSTGVQYDQKITQSAVSEFKDFVTKNPEAELSGHAKKQITSLTEKEAENAFIVGQFYEKQKNFKAAKIYYEDIVNGYKDTKWSIKALERLRAISSKL